MEFDNKQIIVNGSEDSLKIKDFFLLCLSNWYWFVLTITVMMGITMYKVKSTPPTYVANSSILIKQQHGSDFGAIDAVGLNANSALNVYNEIEMFDSRSLMVSVVKRLNAHLEYYREGMFYDRLLYDTTLPIAVNMVDYQDNRSASFTLKFSGTERFAMTDFQGVGLNDLQFSETIDANLGDTITTPLGRVVVSASKYYSPIYMDIYFRHHPFESAVSSALGKLSVEQGNAKTSIINLSYSDVSGKRAEDMLKTVIDVYNENWIADKNQISVSTAMFISDRLGVIEQELGNVDLSLSSYRSRHLVPDARGSATIYMNQISEVDEQIRSLNEQVEMSKYIRSYLTDAFQKNQLLPANTGLSENGLDGLINDYNVNMMDRNSMVANSSESNPLVIEKDNELSAMRNIILETLNNTLRVLDSRLMTINQRKSEIMDKITSTPTQSQYLLSTERQQSVKEQLYLYLLQKREENEISQAFTAYNTRMVSEPAASSAPVSPQPRKMYMMAMIIGFIIPLVILFFVEVSYSKVRGRKDLENLSVPFLGEIPLVDSGNWFMKKDCGDDMIVVKPKNRNAINEAFRVLRTNLEFVIEHRPSNSVIMITSLNSGGGKTFMVSNIAMSLAIRNKRVLVIDFDMRKASFSKLINRPTIGVANYLNGDSGDIHRYISKGALHENLDILPVGVMPPNPTELLRDSKFPQMIKYLRTQYDLILIDTPPIEVVADTSIINTVVDITLFVIRAELFEKDMLPVVENAYKNGSYNNLYVILNGTYDAYKRYGYRRYGYRYGYHYGYGNQSDKYYHKNE